MGLNVNNSEVDSIYINAEPLIAIYCNDEKIWPEDIIPVIDIILSCYYNGYWIDDYPWTDDTPWTD